MWKAPAWLSRLSWSAVMCFRFFFQAEGGIRYWSVTGVQTCALPISPGPTIEAVEGDRVRILVTNHLPEDTSVHWHGVLLPNGMDGVQGLNQPHIKPGETFAYEFTLRQSGTQMYHPHADETLQMALGMEGFFIIHPRQERVRIDRDFAVFLHEWDVPIGGATPNPATMTDFNLFSFNGRVFPGTAPLIVKR